MKIPAFVFLAALLLGSSFAADQKAPEKADPSIMVIPGHPGCDYEVITNVVGILPVPFGSKGWRGVPGSYTDKVVEALDAARIYAKQKGGDAVIFASVETVPFSDGVINSDAVSKAIGVVKVFGSVVKLQKPKPKEN